MVEQFTPEHDLWQSYIGHLRRHKMRHWVIQDDEGKPEPDHHFLGVAYAESIIGHISLHRQQITSPATPNTAPVTVHGPTGEALQELFVATFAVDAAHRHRGHGRALQLAALQLTKTLGCYQMRSWSSVDRAENYALKLSLGFTIHPATQQTRDGQQISGVYFIKTV